VFTIDYLGLFKAAREYSISTTERMMQVNYLAPFFLSVGLVGHMKPDSRILNVTGGSYKYGTCVCKNLFESIMRALNWA
jgi:NAD(P)-dependent dehydrogenase (short-subunit alcohol dehydrogenase family)